MRYPFGVKATAVFGACVCLVLSAPALSSGDFIEVSQYISKLNLTFDGFSHKGTDGKADGRYMYLVDRRVKEKKYGGCEDWYKTLRACAIHMANDNNSRPYDAANSVLHADLGPKQSINVSLVDTKLPLPFWADMKGISGQFDPNWGGIRLNIADTGAYSTLAHETTHCLFRSLTGPRYQKDSKTTAYQYNLLFDEALAFYVEQVQYPDLTASQRQSLVSQLRSDVGKNSQMTWLKVIDLYSKREDVYSKDNNADHRLASIGYYLVNGWYDYLVSCMKKQDFTLNQQFLDSMLNNGDTSGALPEPYIVKFYNKMTEVFRSPRGPSVCLADTLSLFKTNANSAIAGEGYGRSLSWLEASYESWLGRPSPNQWKEKLNSAYLDYHKKYDSAYQEKKKLYNTRYAYWMNVVEGRLQSGSITPSKYWSLRSSLASTLSWEFGKLDYDYKDEIRDLDNGYKVIIGACLGWGCGNEGLVAYKGWRTEEYAHDMNTWTTWYNRLEANLRSTALQR